MAKIVGIDLGTYSVKAVTIETKGVGGKAGTEIVAFGEALVGDAVEDGWRRALTELKQRGCLEGDSYVAGLHGGAAAVRTLTMPFGIQDRAKLTEALPATLEGEISLDLEDIVYGWQAVEEHVDAKTKQKTTQVMTAFTKKEEVRKLLDVLEPHGIDPRYVELDALALDDLWESVLKGNHALDGAQVQSPGGTMIDTSEGAPQAAVAIVDIGHRHTTVSVLHEDRVVAAHTILHGGADATRALSQEIGISIEEAEQGKRKEAFIEVLGAEAQFQEQRLVSDVLKRAYAPIVKRLRQTVQSLVSSSRLRIVKMVLTGGGSRVLNLDRHLAEQLNIKVVRPRELGVMLRPVLGGMVDDPMPHAALALAYALSGAQGNRARTRIDFRTGPFAYQGDFDFLRERAPAVVRWAAAIAIALAANAGVQSYLLSKQESEASAKVLATCKEILGHEELSISKCDADIKAQIAGTSIFQVPTFAATDVLAEVSKRLPPSTELKRKIVEFDVTGDRARLKGTAGTIAATDALVERLKGGKCFSGVEKGAKVRTINPETVEWEATITLDCLAAPGDDGSNAAAPTTAPSPTTPITTTPQPPAPLPMSPGPELSRSTGRPVGMVDPATASAAAADDLDRSLLPSDPGYSPGGLSKDQVEERRERLKQLREDRAARRKEQGPLLGPGGLPVGLPTGLPAGPLRGAAGKLDALRERGKTIKDGAKQANEDGAKDE